MDLHQGQDTKLRDEPTPIAFFNLADAYWESAKALQENRITAVMHSTPVIYLFSHSIEIFLKSYLLKSEFTIDTLRRRFGHSIYKLMIEAQRNGLELSDASATVIDHLDATKEGEKSRYHENRIIRPIGDQVMLDATGELRNAVGESLIANGVTPEFVRRRLALL